MDVAELQRILKTHGPLLITGRFGYTHYTGPSEVRDSVGDTPIYGWLSKERIQSPHYGMNHAIVLIGAKTEGSGVVYYVDPRHGVEKIHRMSYETLRQHTMNRGSMLNYSDSYNRYPAGFSDIKRYALYHPRNAV